MELTGRDTLLYISTFLVPGFVLYATLSLRIPRKDEAEQPYFLRIFTLSCVHQALWLWLTYIVMDTSFRDSHPIWTVAIVIWVLLLSPSLEGLACAALSQKGTMRTALGLLGLRVMHPMPTAWDYVWAEKFSSVPAGKDIWVLVTLKDGSSVAGLYGTKSFASSEPAERDLYVQKVYETQEGKPWVGLPESEGIWLSGAEIKHVEFWIS